MAFVRAVGHDGRTFLQSVGSNIRESCYDKVFALLDGNYGREENILFKPKSLF